MPISVIALAGKLVEIGTNLLSKLNPAILYNINRPYRLIHHLPGTMCYLVAGVSENSVPFLVFTKKQLFFKDLLRTTRGAPITYCISPLAKS